MGLLDFNNDGRVSFTESAIALGVAGVVGQHLTDDLDELERAEKRERKRERGSWDDDYDDDRYDDDDDDDRYDDDDDDDDYDDDDDDSYYDDDDDDWSDDDSNVVEKRFYVAGIKFEDRENIWKAAEDSGTDDIELVPEPENDYDSHAVAVYVDGEHGGYVPANEAKSVFRYIESGADVRVVDHTISVHDGEWGSGSETVSVWLTVECEDY